MTSINRATREILAWEVVTHPERSDRTFQRVIDQAPQAALYYSDEFGIYQSLRYPARSSHIAVKPIRLKV